MKGEWPDKIDHEDHVGSNNSWDNLRDVSHAENMKNMSLHSTNKSGVSGVYMDAQARKWRAQYYSNGKTKYIGLYENFDEAVLARKKVEAEYGYHANHGNSEKG